MKYLKILAAILLFPIPGSGQEKSSDELTEFKDVWVIENNEDVLKFKAGVTNMELSFRAVFNKNNILSFSMDLNGSCPCTPTLDRINEVKGIKDTGSHLHYRAEYIYTGFSIESPKKKLVTKKVPVELRINRVNHQVDLKIDNKTVTKQQTNFTYGIGLNSRLVKYGTSLPSAASVR
ncbi:MAG: hypothetical protein U0X91_08530 [Spirosomataceae bacterium]